ncbi:guanine nucleotide-binding protein subunit beta-like protein 1 isoform X1 [Myxocyprinus asiaticus]|uniref:guanine nucleotide-binding protein subunit beta-like protein 1 isoform X1 n=1 Tax=Myxocyprinus asiaticus TaxID=70543 RepID=UPI0022224708|nr:guanine nucleotide-binding protein subunit beta-like protein 1 isoform X1 [Myxocyprinus asiaticus]XP_051552697.1 guanine nucleotide-binding protein subunit beta-like protein 1 isoform X1 [Myxocyprinus asiaticus]XP_051552698.1 guanine nucleotide-binding protein subunit beta-like protein 1 isoform X1 [Myxocyprinus asiaticus]
MVMARPPPDPLYILRGSGAAVNTLHFSCSGQGPPLLYSGSGKGAIHVWNLTTRRAEYVLESHAGNSVIWLQTFNESNTLISQGRDMQVCLWDMSEGRSTVTDSLLTGSVGFCQCSLLETCAGSTLLAHPTEQMEDVSVVEMRSWTPVCTLKSDSKLGMLMCMKMWQADSGPVLCAGYEDGSLVLWDVSNRRPFSCLKAHPEPVMCLDVDLHRQKGISGSSEKILHSWTLDNQQVLQMNNSSHLTNPGVSQLRIRADGKIVATAGWDNNIRVFGWKKLKPLAVLQHHTDMVNSVAFSDHRDPPQRLLAAGSKDQRISVWSIYSKS